MNPSVPSEAAFDLVKRFEGCLLHSYQDQVGVWTVGYGHTSNVEPDMSITQAEAETLLAGDMNHAAYCVTSCVTAEINQQQFDALCSFVFNLGCGALHGSTLLKLLNSSQISNAGAQFVRWDIAGGKVSRGLLARRQAEAALFSS